MLTRLVFPFQIKAEGDPAGAASHTFEGLAAVWDMDLGNDVIHKGAFKASIKEWKSSGEAMPLLNSHDHFDIMSALGQAVSMEETSDGLLTKWEVIDGPEGDAVMRRLRPSKTTKRPIIGKMSIGFEPEEFSFEQPEGSSPFDRIRHLTKVKLREASLVLFPMAPGASIDATSVKAFMASAQATDPTKLTAEEKMYLRKLAARIGNLLAKPRDGATPSKIVTPPVAKQEDDEPSDEIEEDLPVEDEEEKPAEKPAVEDEGEGDEEGEKSAVVQVYDMADALQQRLQKSLLKTRMSAVAAKK